MPQYNIRIERRGGQFQDVHVGGKDAGEARQRFQNDNADLAPFDWRGLVVFVQGTRPAEEKNLRNGLRR